MSKKDPFDLGTDARGNYKRAIGWKCDGDGYKTHTFYLGRDRAAAGVASTNLEKCWDAVRERWGQSRDKETPRPVWDETTLEVAKAVAAGDARVAVTYPLARDFNLLHWGEAADLALMRWLDQLRRMFPFMEIDLGDAELRAKVGFTLDQVERRAEKKVAEVKRLKGQTTKGQKLEAALDAYCAHVREKYHGEDGLTEFGGLVLRRVESVKRQLAEKRKAPLSSVNWSFLERWLNDWGNRPQTLHGRCCSVAWARGVIKTIRDFVRWLHRSSDFDWALPGQYEVLPVRIKETAEEIAKEETVRCYRREEVGLLWEYALPRDRLFLLLGLNCGFGLREIATLRTGQIKFKGVGEGYIKRRRTTTKIWGKWVLWPETVAALRWYLGHARVASESPNLVLTDNGTPLAGRTKGGNQRQVIPNAWSRLRERIAKDHPDFPVLFFNKLRKTGASFMRRKFGEEVAGRYLSHGKKAMVDHYAPRDFVKLGKALAKFRSYLGDLLDTVADPFPTVSEGGKNVTVSRGTIKRIQALRRQGFTLHKVAEEVGLAVDTVRRYEKVKL